LPRKRKRRSASKRRRRTVAGHIIPIWELPDRQLTPEQRLLRRKSLEVISLVRRERVSPKKAAKQVGVALPTVIANTNAFRKLRGRLVVKKFDHIPRVLIIYERGRKIIVEVTHSRTGSVVGEYHNAVKEFLDTGKSLFLKKFRNRRFKDIHGKFHRFETRPQAILKIKMKEPRSEFFEIYRR